MSTRPVMSGGVCQYPMASLGYGWRYPMSSLWMCISNLPRLIGGWNYIWVRWASATLSTQASLLYIFLFFAVGRSSAVWRSWEYCGLFLATLNMSVLAVCTCFLNFNLWSCKGAVMRQKHNNSITLVHLSYIISTYLQDLAKLNKFGWDLLASSLP